jgi:hypothetical protein
VAAAADSVAAKGGKTVPRGTLAATRTAAARSPPLPASGGASSARASVRSAAGVASWRVVARDA